MQKTAVRTTAVKRSPFLITEAALNQLTLLSANDKAVVDLVRLYRATKANFREVEHMLEVELNFHLNGVTDIPPSG